MKKRWKNLTPHAIRVLDEDGNVLVEVPPSGVVARVATTSEPLDPIHGIPVHRTVFGAVEGLPPPVEGVFSIVSRLVLEAVKEARPDVFAPGELVRDAEGRPVGCKGLSR